jgi:hypothetical protein
MKERLARAQELKAEYESQLQALLKQRGSGLKVPAREIENVRRNLLKHSKDVDRIMWIMRQRL